MPGQASDHESGGRPIRIPGQWQSVMILLVYGLVALVMTWPAVARLNTHLAGGRWDTLVHQWTFWWVRQSALTGLNPLETDLLFYPVGVSLASHNIAWLNIALWLPLQSVVGRYAGYSILFISTFALNGFAMYLLARDWMGSRRAAFVAGLIYGFWPYTMSHIDHPNMIFICWVPLALLYVRRTLDHGRKRDAVLSGIFIALQGITRWQLLVMGGVVIGLYVLYRFLTDKDCRTRRSLGLLGLAAMVAGMLMAPLAVPVVSHQLTRSFPEDIVVAEPLTNQADLLAYLLPSRSHPVWGDQLAPVRENLDIENVLRPPFLGYAVLALALYGTVKRWRQAGFWLLAACLYLVLALGPELMVNGQLYPGVPMPYRLVGEWFLTPIVRRPHRFNLFLALPVAMLAALGVAELICRRTLRNKASAVVAVLGALILFEYCLIPYRTMLPATPEWYYQLAEEPGEFGVLDLPMHPRGYDKWYMLYQTTHKKPIVEGHVSRIPREAYAFLDSTPFLKELHEENVMDPGLVDVTHQLRPLAEAGVRYIILHPEHGSVEQVAAWRDWLTFEPFHEDADLIVYRTEPRLGRDFTLAHELTDDIGLIRVAFTAERTVKAGSGVIGIEARWASIASPDRDYDVCLNLVNVRGEVAQSECWPLSAQRPSSQWQPNDIVRGEYNLQVDPFLEAGEHALTLALVDEASSLEPGSLVTLGQLKIEALHRDFAEPTPSQTALVQFGERILLRGYDLQPLADSLELLLYWQARQRIERSYKVFVHLVDPSTGSVVAQSDAVPRQWTYPTHWWESGEVVEDLIVLALDGVPPGRYLLRVGVYEPDAAVRLSAYSEDGERYQGDIVTLTEVQR
jgi:hypothetical protein